MSPGGVAVSFGRVRVSDAFRPLGTGRTLSRSHSAPGRGSSVSRSRAHPLAAVAALPPACHGASRGTVILAVPLSFPNRALTLTSLRRAFGPTWFAGFWSGQRGTAGCEPSPTLAG